MNYRHKRASDEAKRNISELKKWLSPLNADSQLHFCCL